MHVQILDTYETTFENLFFFMNNKNVCFSYSYVIYFCQTQMQNIFCMFYIYQVVVYALHEHTAILHSLPYLIKSMCYYVSYIFIEQQQLLWCTSCMFF